MKILPINLNYTPIYKTSSNNKKQNNYLDVSFKQDNTIPYYMPVMFKGNEDKVTLIDNLKSLDSVPCPYCGTIMLSGNQLESVLQRVDYINNTQKLFNFLNKYEKNINPKFSNIILSIKRIGYSNFDKSPDDIMNIVKNDLQKKSDVAYLKCLNDFDEIAGSLNLTESDVEKLNHCKEHIKELPEKIESRNYFYKEFSKILKNDIAELDYPNKNLIYRKLNENVRDNYFNEYLFIDRSGNNESLTKTFLRNLFTYSKSGIHRVNHKIPVSDDNIILNCNHCDSTGKALHNRDLKKQYYFNYIYELSKRALAGDLGEYRTYPVLLQNSIIKNYGTRFSPDNMQTDLSALLKSTGVKTPKYVEFKLVDIPGVYCASCGQKTITHGQKEVIYGEIVASENMYDLLDIFNKNREIIKPKYSSLLKEFSNNLMQIPNISESLMYKKLKLFTYSELQEKLNDSIKFIEDVTDDCNLTKDSMAAVEKCIAKLTLLSLNSTPDKIFPIEDYYHILSNMVGFLDERTRKTIWDNCYPPMVESYSRQITLFSHPSIVEKVGSPLKVMAQFIFAHSMATVDHLDPKYKYKKLKDGKPEGYAPENKQKNLVVMCKDCNSSKSSMELNRWVRKHPEMVKNFEKYIMQIKQLLKDKKLNKKMEYYPYEIAAQFSKLTGIDVSTSSAKGVYEN